MNIIGIDFSLNKPSACVLSNNKYSFYAWPYNIDEKFINALKENGVNVINRVESRYSGASSSDKVRNDIILSNNLANLIISTLNPFINSKTIFAFEGSSFASKGNVALQLTAWRYILVYKLSLLIPLNNIYSYSPLTLKSIAGCSKKGQKKEDMIKAFIKKGPDCSFVKSLREGKLMRPKATKWVDNVDDLIDAYWATETYLKKG